MRCKLKCFRVSISMEEQFDISSNVEGVNLNSSQITLERKGLMPMPIDLVVVLKDGSMQSFYIPLEEARAEKVSRDRR